MKMEIPKCYRCRYWKQHEDNDLTGGSSDYGNCERLNNMTSLIHIQHCEVISFHKSFGCVQFEEKKQ